MTEAPIQKIKYPLNEIFLSIQGEGLYQGTPTVFIRTAGCPIGKVNKSTYPLETCTAWDGREFLCDTDFRVNMRKTIPEILETFPKPPGYRVSITGGEPLIHPIVPLVRALRSKGYPVSIETSGTLPMPDGLPEDTWITCSPKRGFRAEVVPWVNEVKILVDSRLPGGVAEIESLAAQFAPETLIWIQPINATFHIDKDNLKLCTELVRGRPNWRLSYQAHKVWELR